MTDQLLSETQRSAWSSYQRMRVRLSGRLNRELSQASGLSEADYEVLSALQDSPDDSVRALALRCGLEWEKSRLSHQLRRMEQRGLVARLECVEDNRATVVGITGAGREAVAEATKQHEAAVQQYVAAALGAEQLEQLAAISEAILNGLEEPHRA